MLGCVGCLSKDRSITPGGVCENGAMFAVFTYGDIDGELERERSCFFLPLCAFVCMLDLRDGRFMIDGP